jgi:hypothetical protein
MTNQFDGLGLHLGTLPWLSRAATRSVSAENPTGDKGRGAMATEGVGAEAAGDLGQGWKVAPAVRIDPGETFELADIDGPGAIQQLWITAEPSWRLLVLRIFWDDQEHPSVEVPLSDFFATAWDTYAPIASLAVCVNPRGGFNAYWQMPFRSRCRITLENLGDHASTVYYQVNYTLTAVPEHAAYFHAQFRRTNPLPYGEVYHLLDGVQGRGHYVGTHVGWGVNNDLWWGEGELKFFLDGDDAFPTICGTGTEDYFGGAWCFEVDGRYEPYTTPYSGMPLVIRPSDANIDVNNTRFGLYRWHVTDPIRFEADLRVTMQALGWRPGHRRYLPLQDDISSVAYWYQTLPTAPFPPLPGRDHLEVI